jgi:hypothetical protein
MAKKLYQVRTDGATEPFYCWCEGNIFEKREKNLDGGLIWHSKACGQAYQLGKLEVTRIQPNWLAAARTLGKRGSFYKNRIF